MYLHITYKQDLSAKAGSEAARRWTEQVETDDDLTRAVHQLVADADDRGVEISRVIIPGEGLGKLA